ncbi:MAG: hypothetical protein APR53_00695 [Methanoculleus sp. SDB]|nr:MAG: hypothetical protein APR53_00695 [Methanoculleus sp. SDB]
MNVTGDQLFRMAYSLMLITAILTLSSGCIDEPYDTDPGGYNPGYSSSGYGYLQIWTLPPGAHISVDGIYWGSTDEFGDIILELTAGSHRIEVVKDGYEGYSIYETVWTGETTYLDIVLTARAGSGMTGSGQPAPTWDWEPEDDSGPVFVAATRPSY